MAPTPTASSVDELQSADTRKVLDVIDKLRSLHLDSIVQLPRLVVCGDQSSGKSSVLEAITEVPLPRKEALCTRFATEIVLRRAKESVIRARIRPDELAVARVRNKLQNFDKTIKEFGDLQDVIEEAINLMDLPEPKGSNPQQQDSQSEGLKAFSKHVLSIEIHGPDRPALTVVDLPGYVHSATNKHTWEDVKFIQDMIRKYAQEKRTIILAVATAKTDIANQVVLNEVAKADPKRVRTMGIITKMDMLDDDSEDMQEFMELAQNKDFVNHFVLGWHVLRNRSRTENRDKVSFTERNQQEEQYFSRDLFRDIAADNKGIGPLRTRLAGLLNELIKKELPNVRGEIASKLRNDQSSLQQLGEEIRDAAAQKLKLMTISQDYGKIVQAGIHANWDSDPFFNTANGDAGSVNLQLPNKTPDDRHLRSLVRHCEEQFSVQMRMHGHKFRFPQLTSAIPTSAPPSSGFKLVPPYHEASQEQQRQQPWTDNQAISWASNLMAHTELPGQSDTSAVTRLFQELSANWEDLAKQHVAQVDNLLGLFIETVVAHVAGPHVGPALQAIIDEKLWDRRDNAEKELRKIMKVVMQPVSTHDPHFVTKVETLRARRIAARPRLSGTIDLTGEKDAAENALDALLTIYGEMVEYFITSVLRQVIEQNLLDGLVEETLSPISIASMSEEEIANIMAEDNEITRERQRLMSNIKKLEEAQKELATISGPFKRAAEDLPVQQEGQGRLSKRAARRARG